MDELVKRLRAAKVVVFKAEDVALLGEAADAIEELSLTAESYRRSMEAWADEAAKAMHAIEGGMSMDRIIGITIGIVCGVVSALIVNFLFGGR